MRPGCRAARPGIAVELPLGGQAVGVHDEQRAGRPGIGELLEPCEPSCPTVPLCDTMLVLRPAPSRIDAGDVADARVADLAASAVDLGDRDGGAPRSPGAPRGPRWTISAGPRRRLLAEDAATASRGGLGRLRRRGPARRRRGGGSGRRPPLDRPGVAADLLAGQGEADAPPNSSPAGRPGRRRRAAARAGPAAAVPAPGRGVDVEQPRRGGRWPPARCPASRPSR